MRLLVYADLQAHDSDERCYNDPTTSLQIARVRQFFKDLYRVYVEHDCHGLIDLGDTTDDRSAIPVPVIEHVMAGIEPFAGSEYNFKLIGNHEQFLRDTSVDSGRMYQSIFRVISQKAVWDHEDVVYVFASYPDDHETLAKWLQGVSHKHRNRRKVLFGHFQVAGAALGSGEALTGIPKDVVERFEVSLLGHIHLPQSMGRRIHYVGSPFQQNWGEAGHEKRLAILETTDLSLEWVPLTGYPGYRQVNLEGFRRDFKEDAEDRWKVVLDNHAETEAFFALPFSHRAEAVYAYSATEEVAEQAAPKDWSFEASLKHWVETVPLEGLEISHEELVSIGRNFAKG